MLEEVYKRFENDHFANEIGISIISVEEGKAKASVEIGMKHLNGVAIAQGGVTYTLGDFTSALAGNSLGPVAVTIESSISYKKSINEGDILVAYAEVIETNGRAITVEAVITVSNEIKAIMKSKLLSMKK
jgi:acyl-CoA thioesterase